MNKLLAVVLLSLFGARLNSQVLFENDYDSASTFAIGSPVYQDQLLLVNFEITGEHYVKICRHAKKITVYDLTHSLTKTVDFSTFPFDSSNPNSQEFMYFSESLFDTDPGMEFMFLKDPNDPNNCYTGIYNEDGSLIFSTAASPLIRATFHLQQYPIYNTSQGTKLLLSFPNGHAKVYGLAGTLTTAIQIANQNLLQAQGLISNPIPHPVLGTTKIDYTLPKESDRGEIVFFDNQGIEVKRFKVDNTFDHLLISTTDIPAGTYYYQLQTARKVSEGKKMVVIK